MKNKNIYQNISKIRRDYNSWVANESLEDYALRFAPRSFRKWSEFQVANTAFGSTSFLVLEAIGGFLAIHYGFTNAFWAILIVGLVIFITSFPISYYAARYNIDIDLLTRSAGFGYIGSTVTSLIYASFTFTLFALEASIMSLALELYFHIPIALAHVISAVIVIPLVTFGITTISRMQLWTQPVWLALLIAPYIAVVMREQDALLTVESYFWIAGSGQGFNWLLFGSATTVAFSMVAQIGEQVDFLRFMPEKTADNKLRWWLATISAGPGWIIFGMLRQLGGALLAHLAMRHGIPPEHAHEPTQMYLIAYQELFPNPEWALAATTLFVVISQLKINVTNAYAGSLAWSNFFSRITHSHPGRVIWLLFNVLIALLLMEFGVFGALEKVLGLFSNMSIAWISAVAAELLINKPLKLSPDIIEFKRAYLPDLNPVGIIATFVASLVSILAYIGLFGEAAKAFSAFISLSLAFILVPSIAYFTGHKHYLARDRNKQNRRSHNQCCICENEFEHEDIAYCPAYNGSICSLCCTLDARCLDACKPGARLDDYLELFARRFMPSAMNLTARLRLLRFVLLFGFLSVLTSIFIGIIYYQDLLAAETSLKAFELLLANFVKVYTSLMVFIGLCTWWLILNDESRRVAHEETGKQTHLLLTEIEEHKKTDAKLEQAIKMADTANSAKSRFLSNMSHEIRTPLNSIIGYSYILHKDPSIPEHRRQAVDTLKRSGEHLAALIEDILDIARIEARKFELNYEPINFQAFIEHLVRIYKVQAEDKGVAFRCQILSTLPQRVRADEKRVGQILMNILSNAVKFTQAGEITLRIGYSGGVANFQIIDTGQGIEPSQLDAIFQPFTRLNTTTGNAISGSGLGLTISKILAEIMGGDLAVTSTVGKGSTFTVRLFLPNLGAATAPEPQDNITGYRGRRQTALVVDDQPEHRDVMVSILEPLGFVMLTASDGNECLTQAQTHKPDVVLLDLTMPGMGGAETAIHLRKNGLLKPIIVLSANAYPADRATAIQAGCNDFLAKPIQVGDLLYKLKLHLGLTWICQNEEPDLSIAADEALQLPPAEMLQKLQAFVRIGDLLGLNKKLDELIKDNPEYKPLSLRIKTLTSEFRLAEIKKLLA
ncbi:hybrid sensor histidine kinase/response regulator [Methylovulum psychrotolerans]|uniref:histidine kinase n=1 Tax=Methylovulum psychrotolerans TaxID=1704499 RepID=A0A1Z4BUJ4_9GAMM|nr:ATP-binding protein [Methylovulum psychrotolerans]ASF44984.1 hybrid sensor histidine kinase/response regulator [Methylovulum psychrotolerans]MBT9098206.1 response regulator [Methylovulum psychrotolerans]POZ53918.1 hybrid sensor histidine kinase/response regulator [Methylovulum psychrotolerans]